MKPLDYILILIAVPWIFLQLYHSVKLIRTIGFKNLDCIEYDFAAAIPWAMILIIVWRVWG